MSQNRQFTCFFIGRMSSEEDMERLETIAEEVLKPILSPLGYKVITPDSPYGSLDIFKFVMTMLDTADLLVADLTGDNANVYYELAIRHSLGLPYVLISQTPPKFDIAQLRCVIYKPDNLQNARFLKNLQAYIDNKHQIVLTQTDSDNPITEFYGVPLAEVSPASGLGLGYYRNFVRATMKDVLMTDTIVRDASGQELSKDGIRLEVWIPDLLAGAFHGNIKTLLLDTGVLRSVQIVKPNAPRPFTLYARTDIADPVVLVDVPSALNAMEVAIEGRYSGVRLDRQSPEWKKIEREEIDRFQDTVKRLIGNEQEDIQIPRRTSIVRWEV